MRNIKISTRLALGFGLFELQVQVLFVCGNPSVSESPSGGCFCVHRGPKCTSNGGFPYTSRGPGNLTW